MDQSIDRGIYVCQTQSMNIHMPNPSRKDIQNLHYYAWSKGAKTGLYYLRTKGGVDAQQVTVDPKLAEREKAKMERKRRLSNTSALEADTNSALLKQVESF